MWTDTTRALHARSGLALPSDWTDAEWAVLEPLLPPASHVGRPRKWPLRRILEAILYLLRGGLPWRMLPPCFPPVSTVRRWFYLWRDDGLWLTLNHTLLMAAREADGREASPSAGVIDSQSVKTTESGGPRGYDAGKKTKGRKRHILTDTDGNLVHAVIHSAAMQDRKHPVNPACETPLPQAMPYPAVAAFQFHGSSSSRRAAGMPLILARTSASHA